MSSVLRQKLPSATTRKPAASTSWRNVLSSMRCSVLPTDVPWPGSAEWSAITKKPPGFSAVNDLQVHRGAIDVHVRRVVVVEEERYEVEIVHVRRHWIVEGPYVGYDVFG